MTERMESLGIDSLSEYVKLLIRNDTTQAGPLSIFPKGTDLALREDPPELPRKKAAPEGESPKPAPKKRRQRPPQ